MFEQNKEVVRRFFDAINRQDLDALGEVIAEDIVWHGGSMGEITGRENFQQMVGPFYVGFPDLRVDIDDLLAEEDWVAARYTVTGTGTHQGDLFGVPGTGKKVRYGGQPTYRIANGKVAEVWFFEDDVGLMRQIGAIPGG